MAGPPSPFIKSSFIKISSFQKKGEPGLLIPALMAEAGGPVRSRPAWFTYEVTGETLSQKKKAGQRGSEEQRLATKMTLPLLCLFRHDSVQASQWGPPLPTAQERSSTTQQSLAEW